MGRKLIGIFICTLLIATAIPAVESFKNYTINATNPNTSLTSMEGNWTEWQKLLASDGASFDGFGTVSLDGDTALIGATGDSDNGPGSGSAYVFTRSGSIWTQQAKLLASDGAEEDNFGISVSLSGDTALIGAHGNSDNGLGSGSAYVFTRTGTTWTQQALLLASDGAEADWFGWAVSLSGDTALIGAFGDDVWGTDSGSAYVFTRSGTIWTQQARLVNSDGEAGDYFGFVVSLSGDTALIGTPNDDEKGLNSGSAYVFTRTGITWTEQARLNASDGAANDMFGWSVALDGEYALIGAPFDDDNGVSSGSAYVFTRSGTTWTQQQKLFSSDGAVDDSFGCSVSLADDTALIGAFCDDENGVDSGSAYMFIRSDTTWTQQAKLLASDGAEEDYFGVYVSLSGPNALIGSPCDDDNGDYSGSIYIFTKENVNKPPVFGTPTPGNGSTNNPLSFTWNTPINDPNGDAFSWTIQCSNGQANSGTDATNGTKSLLLSDLACSTTYTVWVNATDPTGSGLYTRGWYTFATKANQPPNTPTMTGPAEGKVGIATDYNFTAIDPDDNEVYYFIDWGDNSTSGWIGPSSSGDQITQSHTWSKKGTYTIKAKAKDTYGNESAWGTLEVTMPVSINMIFHQIIEKLFERFQYVFPILRQLLGY